MNKLTKNINKLKIGEDGRMGNLKDVLKEIKEGKKIDLILDNDSCTFHNDDEDGEIILTIHNQELLEQALTELGIIWQWC